MLKCFVLCCLAGCAEFVGRPCGAPRYVIGDVEQRVHLVAADEHRASVIGQFAEDAREQLRILRADPTKWLVREQAGRSSDENRREFGAPTFATGELVRALIQYVRHAGAFGRPIDTAAIELSPQELELSTHGE